MSDTEILVRRLRDLADALERLDADEPLPALYVSVWGGQIDSEDFAVNVQVSRPTSGDPDDLEVRQAVARRIDFATPWHVYAPAAEDAEEMSA